MMPTMDLPGAAARREACFVAGAIDVVVVLLMLPLFLGFAGLTVLLQTNWLEVDPSGREWLWGYVVATLWFAAPLWYVALGAAFGVTAAGDAPSPRRALGRALLLYPSLGLLGLGPLIALTRGDSRPFHDSISGTYVWQLDRTP
jgi:hypothetical protein